MGVLGTIMSNISFNITFLDELFSNMDAELRSTMCQVLRQNQKPGQTLFIISHVELDNKYFDGQINAKLEYIDEVHKKSVYTMTKNIIEGP
jgi:ABC-type thiamine transport system ATPase subunit